MSELDKLKDIILGVLTLFLYSLMLIVATIRGEYGWSFLLIFIGFIMVVALYHTFKDWKIK